MRLFLEAWTEFKMNEQEQECENMRETIEYRCQNNNGGGNNGDGNNGNNGNYQYEYNGVYYEDAEEMCQAQQWDAEGMGYCMEVEDENEEDFEVQRMIECEEVEGQNGNGGQG